ncbi:hypothetical protein ACIBW9_00720 [Streptomyces sp. NPDC049541]|uniref:hypothetical protein n=1 Tax=Streptomyces sp. NPDC049541 TaxID=3365594 RepID=UPI003794107E
MPTPGRRPSRRSVVTTGVGLVIATGLDAMSAPSAAAAPDGSPSSKVPAGHQGDRPITGAHSANGWPVEKGADIGGSIWTQTVAGSAVRVALRLGEVSTVLQYVLRRYHYEIDTLVQDEVIGYRVPGRALQGHLTNHASGTAVAIRPGAYPPGATDGMFPQQRAVVADILKECENVVRWGGTFRRSYEAHFEIGVAPADPLLSKVADRIRRAGHTPGEGAGVLALGC